MLQKQRTKFNAMKTLIATLLVLFLSIPTVMAGSVDGTGIWCDRPGNEFGYWFEDSKYIKHSITGHSIYILHSEWDYGEIGTDKIKLGNSTTLNRKTLEIRVIDNYDWVDYPCYLVNSRQALDAKLQATIDQGKAENKL